MIIIHLVPLENSRIRSQVIPDEGKEIRIMVTKNMQNWGVIKFSVTSNFVHYTCSKHVTLYMCEFYQQQAISPIASREN